MRYLLILLLPMMACKSIQQATNFLEQQNVLDSICAAKYPNVKDTSFIKQRDTAYENSLLRRLDSLALVIDEMLTPNILIRDTCTQQNIGKPMVTPESAGKLHAQIASMRTTINSLRQDLQTKRAPCDTSVEQYSSGPQLAFCQRQKAALEKKYTELLTDYSKVIDGRNWWRNAALITWLIIVIVLVIWIFGKKIMAVVRPALSILSKFK